MKCKNDISNYGDAYNHFYKEAWDRAMKDLNDERKARKRVLKELKQKGNQITQYGYNKFFEEAKEKSDKEYEKSKQNNPEFDWKNANTPRSHKHWFRGRYILLNT